MKSKKSLGFLFLLLMGCASTLWAATSYQVVSGGSTSINEFSTCKLVTNNETKDIFVPTNTTDEWTAFFTSPPANVTAGTCAATQLVWTTQPASSITAGANITFVVKVEDAFGNIITTGPDATATITVSITSGSGTLGGTVSKAAVAGVATFAAADTVNINLIGAKTLQASKDDQSGSGGAGVLSADSNSFTIVHAAASQIAYTTQPATNTAAGAYLLPVLEIQDTYGNVVSTGVDATATVTLTKASGTGTLSGTVALAAVGGVVTYTATQAVYINLVGSKTLTATKASTVGGGGTASVNVTSSAFTIVADVPATLAWFAQPDATRTTGVDFTTGTITITDAFGNACTNWTDPIVFSVDDATNPTGADLMGVASVTQSNGVAVVTAANIQTVGTGYKLVADTNGVTSPASNSITVNVGTATKLYFSQVSSTWPAAQSVIPGVIVQVTDAYNNLVSSCAGIGNITLTIGTNPGGGTLSSATGSTGIAPTACAATFSATNAVQINNAGTGYTLNASTTAGTLCGGGLCTGGSTTFNVTSTPGLNLEHAVELLDVGIYNRTGTGTTSSNLSRTTFSTAQYSGTVTYAFEIVGKNYSGGTAASISLVNGSAAAMAAVTIPANTTTATRYRTVFTPGSASTNYRVQVPRNNTQPLFHVMSARIIVTQSNSYATMQYVPLLSALGSISIVANATTTPVDSVTLTSYTQGTSDRYGIFHYDAAQWDRIPTNGLTFEADISGSSATYTTYAALYDITGAVTVPASEVTVASTTISNKKAVFDVSKLTDGHDYEVRIRSSNTAGTARLWKAGLWVTVWDLNKYVAYRRVAPSMTSPGATFTSEVNRQLIDTTSYTTPTVNFECSGVTSSGSQTVDLVHVSTTDAGTGAITLVASSAVTLPGSRGRVQSTSLTLPAGSNRFLGRINGATGTNKVGLCSVLVSH